MKSRCNRVLPEVYIHRQEGSAAKSGRADGSPVNTRLEFERLAHVVEKGIPGHRIDAEVLEKVLRKADGDDIARKVSIVGTRIFQKELITQVETQVIVTDLELPATCTVGKPGARPNIDSLKVHVLVDAASALCGAFNIPLKAGGPKAFIRAITQQTDFAA